MSAALLVAALSAPVAADQPPAPLADRWLLKLAPDGLPDLPDSFYKTTWHDSFLPRSLRGAWQMWVEFRRPEESRPAEVRLTRIDERFAPKSAGAVQAGPEPRPIRRTVALAVQGPLVEFDRRLYTATVRIARRGKIESPVLDLGSAVEAKGNVWYQAGTRTDEKGNTVVEEWRLEFKENPREAVTGNATVRYHGRVLTEPEGKSFAAEVRFTVERADDPKRVRLVRLAAPDGVKLEERLPNLAIGDVIGAANTISARDQHRMTLVKAAAPAPPAEEAPGLVEPPKKKP